MRNNYLFLPLSYCENLFAKGINSLTIEIGRLLFEEYVLEYVWNQFFFWIETFSNTYSKSDHIYIFGKKEGLKMSDSLS